MIRKHNFKKGDIVYFHKCLIKKSFYDTSRIYSFSKELKENTPYKIKEIRNNANVENGFLELGHYYIYPFDIFKAKNKIIQIY